MKRRVMVIVAAAVLVASSLAPLGCRKKVSAQQCDELKNCASQVQASEHACAMNAQSSEALIKCLE